MTATGDTNGIELLGLVNAIVVDGQVHFKTELI